MATPNGKLHVSASDDLEYCYRDLFKAYVGDGEVLLEFANINRTDPSQVVVRDRIVLSIANTVRLVQHLQKELQQGKERFENKHGSAD